MKIEQALDRHQDRLMALPGVSGVGIGQNGGRPIIVILVEDLAPALLARLPRTLEGHPVLVESSGPIVSL